jgi:acyl carrier protein
MNGKDDTPLTFRVQSLLASTLRVPADLVTSELAFGDIPQWDSMGHMEVMMSLEERFSVEINDETIRDLVSVPIICQYIQEHNNG